MTDAGRRRRVLIMGAAGRDFHNFNTAFRGDEAAEVVAFTAAQIPGIAGRRYPAVAGRAVLSGRHPDPRGDRSGGAVPGTGHRRGRVFLQRHPA